MRVVELVCKLKGHEMVIKKGWDSVIQDAIAAGEIRREDVIQIMTSPDYYICRRCGFKESSLMFLERVTR